MNKRALLFSAVLLAVTPAQAADPQFAAKANALCRAAIDARDYSTFKGAQDGSLDLTLATVKGEAPPSPEEAAALSRLLHSVNTDLAATIERLQSLPPSPDLDAFLAYGQSRIAINTARIGFLADLDHWQWPPADALDTSSYHYRAGMAALGFTDLDCTYVFGSLGNPPELASFITHVALACNVAYDRLLETDLDQWREHNLNAMVAVLQDKPQDPDAIPAIRKLAAAWKEAAHAFALVDTRIDEKPPLWEDAIAILYERARILKDRADALEYRDADAIRAAFANRIGGPDFDKLGLRETSCMAMAKLI